MGGDGGGDGGPKPTILRDPTRDPFSGKDAASMPLGLRRETVFMGNSLSSMSSNACNANKVQSYYIITMGREKTMQNCRLVLTRVAPLKRNLI